MQDVEIGGNRTLPFFIAGVAAATAIEWPLYICPFNLTLISARWVPAAAVTANGSNFATLSFRNRTGAGAGTAVPASRSYAATNSVAEVAEVMTNSATATDLQFATGDVLTLGIAHTGTGLTIPAGLLLVTVQGR